MVDKIYKNKKNVHLPLIKQLTIQTLKNIFKLLFQIKSLKKYIGVMHFKKKKRYANDNQNTSLFQKKLNHYILDKT